MSLKQALIATAWVVSLLATNSWTNAQTQRWTLLSEPVVVAGDDVGFRIEWMNGRTPTGKIVVRLGGQWVEARVGEPRDRSVVPPVPAPPPPPR